MRHAPRPGAAGDRRARAAVALLTAALLAALTLLALSQLRPPRVAPAGAPATTFSAERAAEHVAAIARQPHPVGSPENARVRDYLLAQLRSLGLEPAVQAAAAVHPARWEAGSVENIVARLPGSASTGGVLLMAHYDSVATGPGAADDGAGVAAILEAVRALRAGPPLRNDLIVLLTDGEEAGLLGALAFAREHPWARDVGVVLNFEARGARGPSLMFETSAGNRWLIEEFARAGAPTVATSLMVEIYRRLPNDTDFTVMRASGLAGLNFAFGGDWPAYHTMRDSLANLDRRSLQHHGEYALALGRHLGDLDLGRARTGDDAIYFTLFGRLVHYPAGWAAPLAAAAALAFAAVVALGLRRRRLTARGVLLGLLAPLAGALASGAAVAAAWLAVGALWGRAQEAPLGGTYGSGLYAAAFVALTIAATSGVVALFRREAGADDLLAGALGVWLALAALTGVALPGGSYLFLWPLLSGLLALGATVATPAPVADRMMLLAGLLPAAVGLLLWAPMLALLFEFLPVAVYWGIAAALALVLALLAPHLDLLAAPGGRWLPSLALTASLCLLAASAATARPGPDRPTANSVFYSLDAGTGRAIWASLDPRPDRWTAQFLSESPERGVLAEAVPMPVWADTPIWKREAPPVPLAGATVAILEDATVGEARRLRLRVVPPPGVAAVLVSAAAGLEVRAVAVDGTPLNTPALFARFPLRYANPRPEGFELALEVPITASPALGLATITDGLPPLPGVAFAPRPADMQPAWRFGGVTVVSQAVHLAPR